MTKRSATVLSLFVLLILIGLAGCRVVETPPAPTSAIQVGQAAAVQAAEQACPGIYMQSLEPARLVQARLVSRVQAEAISACASRGPEWAACLAATAEPAPTSPLAWLVQLEGRWSYEGPPAPQEPGSTPYPPTAEVIQNHCLVVVDARTGEAGPVMSW
jgi:hypothetical protein